VQQPVTFTRLGDFTASRRLLILSAIAVGLGLAGAVIAVALLDLIALSTNLFFHHRLSIEAASPVSHELGRWAILVPVLGGLIVGLIARFGSERIRGHGIPEAIEAILMNGSRVEPKLAILKPLSAAIAIGSGGPFGAEGPIVMTGGAVGSLVAQCFHLSSAERKTLLVAGAAAGMSAVFATPLAAVLLAVELLLFEWKPRSFVPAALAAATAAAARRWLLGLGPIFPVTPHPVAIPMTALALCCVSGALAAALSIMMTRAVYASEDAFLRLPIHWMWWPAIGGIAIGIGGWFFPQALGVGYDTIGALLQGDVPVTTLAGILFVKFTIWAIALGSGTSGGVLAPLLMVGGALGGLEAQVFPAMGPGFWPLVSMAAVLGGTMRTPFTAVVFALELTHDFNMVLPLLAAVTIAYAVTVLGVRRSILTEKIARRGYHLTREYSIDPLEIVFVREVMQPLDAAGMGSPAPRGAFAYPDEPLRAVAYRMAATGATWLPVVDPDSGGAAIGAISLGDLLQGRMQVLDAEQRRERVLTLRTLVPAWVRERSGSF
jgi:CIC family chloride channel protein